MRISRTVPLLLLAACGQAPGDDRALAGAEAGPHRRAAADRIPCAQGTAPLVRACTVDRTAGADGLVLTLRHPDGAFRRLRVTTDGRGVVAADGAQPARVGLVATGGIEVAIGEDRYRLPATIKGTPPTP